MDKKAKKVMTKTEFRIADKKWRRRKRGIKVPHNERKEKKDSKKIYIFQVVIDTEN